MAETRGFPTSQLSSCLPREGLVDFERRVSQKWKMFSQEFREIDELG